MESRVEREARRLEEEWFTIPEMPKVRTRPEEGTPFWGRWHGVRVHGATWGRGPCVYLVHGWGGESGSLGAFVAPLVESGHRVVAFDWPSHGRSGVGLLGPGRSSALEMAGAMGVVAGRFEEHPAAVVSHSLGATAALLAIESGRVTPDRLVLLAPVVDLPEQLAMFQASRGHSAEVQHALVERVERRVEAPITDFSAEHLLGLARLPETLVLHDPADPIAPLGHIAEQSRRNDRIHLTEVPGRGHFRVLVDSEVVSTATAFVEQRGWEENDTPAAS